VEGIDFRLEWPGFDWRTLGRRLMSINLSDLEAMGAEPMHALISCGLRHSLDVSSVIRLYQGIADQARRFRCTVAGGDLSSTTGPLVLTVALIGKLPLGGAPMRRGGARAGWGLAVTGKLGGAAAGLALLEAGRGPATAAERRWVRAQLDPLPRVRAGRVLHHRGIRVAGDISDGLFREVERIADASGLGAALNVDSLPIDPVLQRAHPGGAWRLALDASEDFELVCAAPSRSLAALAPRFFAETGLKLTVVGELTPNGGIRLHDDAGQAVGLTRAGYEHFR
jgi:thiamine-monophosphate kinase